MSDDRRVVVTGLGMVTGLGGDRESSWEGIRRGSTGIRRLRLKETGGGERDWLGASAGRWVRNGRDPVLGLGMRASEEALADAGLAGGEKFDGRRAACTLSTSKGGLATVLAEHRRLLEGGSPSAKLIEEGHAGALAGIASRRFGLEGPSCATVAACASGLHSIIHGYHLIHEDEADVVLSGASDASLLSLLLGSYESMGVLSRGLEDPEGAVKPFDRERDGFAVGEGAGVLVLESLGSARRRGARVYAEVAGWARGAEAYHLTSMAARRSQLGRLLAEALERAEVSARELDYINAHGTATKENDILETRAIHEALGREAGRVAVSSIKAATGHLLGAAAAVEAVVTVLAMRDGYIPPTLNLRNPDPECDLDYVPLVGRKKAVRTAACTSAGFGGQIGVVVFKGVE